MIIIVVLLHIAAFLGLLTATLVAFSARGRAELTIKKQTIQIGISHFVWFELCAVLFAADALPQARYYTLVLITFAGIGLYNVLSCLYKVLDVIFRRIF